MDGCDVVTGGGSGDVGADGVVACGRGWRGGGGVCHDDVIARKNASYCAGEGGVRGSVGARGAVDVDDERRGILGDGEGSVDGGEGVVGADTGYGWDDRVGADRRVEDCCGGIRRVDGVTVDEACDGAGEGWV